MKIKTPEQQIKAYNLMRKQWYRESLCIKCLGCGKLEDENFMGAKSCKIYEDTNGGEKNV
jgi:hypothetical protein